jgi:hypothetical protein
MEMPYAARGVRGLMESTPLLLSALSPHLHRVRAPIPARAHPARGQGHARQGVRVVWVVWTVRIVRVWVAFQAARDEG